VGAERVTLDVRLELAAIPQTIRVTQEAEDEPGQSKRGEVVMNVFNLQGTGPV
jgi:hypothetical protein